jgi:protein involved in polysaccharide export with SLBB domain
MRRFFLFLGALCAAGLTVASGQNVIPNNTRNPAPESPSAPPTSDVAATGKVVSADSPLIPGDYVSIKIEEDWDEPDWKTVVTDTGEVEINVLGSVKVSDRTAAEAANIIRNYLLKDYYNQATVTVKIIKKAQGFVRPDKVTVAGKVGRPGPQYFNDANPLKLSEAVIIAGTSVYSDLKHVQLTRGGQNVIYNVEDITKNGRTELDVRLRNGDQIFVRERGWVY